MRGSISQTMRSWLVLKSRVGRLTDWATQVPLMIPKCISPGPTSPLNSRLAHLTKYLPSSLGNSISNLNLLCRVLNPDLYTHPPKNTNPSCAFLILENSSSMPSCIKTKIIGEEVFFTSSTYLTAHISSISRSWGSSHQIICWIGTHLMIPLYTGPSHHHLSLNFYKSPLTGLCFHLHHSIVWSLSLCIVVNVTFVKHKLGHAIRHSKPFNDFLLYSEKHTPKFSPCLEMPHRTWPLTTFLISSVMDENWPLVIEKVESIVPPLESEYIKTKSIMEVTLYQFQAQSLWGLVALTACKASESPEPPC